MIIDMLESAGVPRPVSMTAGQIVVRNSEGTPIFIALEGPDGAVDFAHAGDNDFPKYLSLIGELPVEVVDYGIITPKFSGAHIFRG